MEYVLINGLGKQLGMGKQDREALLTLCAELNESKTLKSGPFTVELRPSPVDELPTLEA